MSWLEAIHHKFYRDKQIDAAKSTIRRLLGRPPRHRYLRPESLDGKRVYYCLTPSAARLLGFPSYVADSLGCTALIRRYALQWFIEIDGLDQRWLCQPRDYPELFDVKSHRLPRANFYLEKRGEITEIGFAIEDYGSDARRIARRATDLLERFLLHGWFDAVITANRFAVSFLTVSSDKARSIEGHFERNCELRLSHSLKRLGTQRAAQITTDYLVVPGLIALIER